MSAGETRIIGTCRLGYADSLSQSAVEVANLALMDADHGAWELVVASDTVSNLKAAEKAHKKSDKHLLPGKKTPFGPPR